MAQWKLDSSPRSMRCPLEDIQSWGQIVWTILDVKYCQDSTRYPLETTFIQLLAYWTERPPDNSRIQLDPVAAILYHYSLFVHPILQNIVPSSSQRTNVEEGRHTRSCKESSCPDANLKCIHAWMHRSLYSMACSTMMHSTSVHDETRAASKQCTASQTRKRILMTDTWK